MSWGCVPRTDHERERYRKLVDLKELFNGESIQDIDKKFRKGDKVIETSYGLSDTAFGDLMFRELVWRSTYRTPEAYASFKDSDLRRIANEIQKEANNLRNPKLSFLEKYGFVKRGVMQKHAVTNWFNKMINTVTNFERTKYSTFILRNRDISSILRLESIRRGDQSKRFLGIKSEKDLEKLERKLFEKLHDIANAREHNESVIELDKEAGDIRDQIQRMLSKEGGLVLKEFAEYMHSPPTDGLMLDKSGNPFKKNIIKAGKVAREMLDDMGGVFINGLKGHKRVINLAFLKKENLTKEDKVGEVGKRLVRYRKRIDDQIKAIEEGMIKGDYFPHFLMDGMVRLEKLTSEIEKRNEEATTREWSPTEASRYMEDIESIFSSMRENINKSPVETRQRKKIAYDNWMQNPLAVLRKYGYDAIAFNKNQFLKSIYMRTMKHMPRDGDAATAMRKYVTDVYTLADKGFTDRPTWVNRMVRTITGFEFLSKIGFGVGTAARNTMSGMYYIQGLGNRKFLEYLTDLAHPSSKSIVDEIKVIEQEQGFLFRDLAEELYTEGMIPTKGVRVSEVDMIIDQSTGKPRFSYKADGTWKTFDSGLSWAAGKAAIFQRVTENMLRKHMFRSAYMTKRKELKDMDVPDTQGRNSSKAFALDMVNKYAFEYAAHQKAPIAGGHRGYLGATGQVVFQFMHYPMSFLQQQSEILRNSKDAAVARQWDNPDVAIPIRFGALYLLTHLLSGVFNRDLHRIMENDIVDRIKNIYDVVGGEEEVMGRGYIGPAVGELFFYATLYDLIELPENDFVNLVVGYNDAGKLTDEQKTARVWSSLNVEVSKWVNKQIPMILSGRGGNIMMHELGLYPRKWTKELHERIFGKWATTKKGKKKEKAPYVVPSYAQPLGSTMTALNKLPKSNSLNKYSPEQISTILQSLST